MKKTVSTFMAAALIASVIQMPGSVSAASTEWSLRLDQQLVEMDVKPVLHGKEIFVPVSVIHGWKDVKFRWNQKDKSVNVWAGGIRYDIKTGSSKVKTSKSHISLPAPVYIEKGRMMIPASLLKAMTGATMKQDAKLQAVLIDTHGKRPIAAAEGQKGVKLFGLNEKDGVYQKLALEIGGTQKTFAWTTPASWKDVPALHVKDLNGDGQSEVLVVLRQGSGTGMYLEEVHIVNSSNLTEVPLESLEETLSKRVTSTIVREDNHLKVSIDWKDSGIKLSIPAADRGQTENKEVGFGAVIRHSIENGKLIARVGGAINNSEFIGDLEIVYGLNKDRYEAEKVSFVPFKEYKEFVQK